MKPVLLGSDWLPRMAWGLSAVVHAGVAGAFLGWAEPASTVPQAIAVTVVALAPSAAGDTERRTEGRSDPPAARPAAPPEPAPAIHEAADSVPPPVESPRPEPHENAPMRALAPAEAAPTPVETAHVALPMPARKPPAPAAVEPAAAPPAEAAATERLQTAGVASPPPPEAVAPAAGGASGGPPASMTPGGVTPASLNVAGLSNPEPDYPMTSRLRHEEGSVLLEVTVSAAGSVSSIRVVESSGHSRLDKAALEAVRDWRFVPARIGDRPIEAVIRHRVVFRLDG